MTRSSMTSLVAVAVGPIGWCLALGALIGGDPMLGIEIGVGALFLIWTGLLVRDVAASRRVAAALSIDGRDAHVFGVPCRITEAIGAEALVVGAVRPRIFVGADLLGRLSDEELRAVVYHEDHHRRTLAPLRAAALSAWLRLLGHSPTIRRIVIDRLSDLESLADAEAIRRGSDPRSLARALLKSDASLQPVGFSYAAERRVGHLLDRAAGLPWQPDAWMPYEWAPLALLLVAVVGCHAGL